MVLKVVPTERLGKGGICRVWVYGEQNEKGVPPGETSLNEGKGDQTREVQGDPCGCPSSVYRLWTLVVGLQYCGDGTSMNTHQYYHIQTSRAISHTISHNKGRY